jgi:hypothetical protein
LLQAQGTRVKNPFHPGGEEIKNNKEGGSTTNKKDKNENK